MNGGGNAREVEAMFEALGARQIRLVRHPLHRRLDSPAAIRLFTEYHVFAVWDAMTLLKALQRRLTCVDLPWRPARIPGAGVRLLNALVLENESRRDANGRVASRFERYVDAMEELGADTGPIRRFAATLDLDQAPEAVRPFVTYHMRLANEGTDEEVAAALFPGRRLLLPDLFQAIADGLGTQAERCQGLLQLLTAPATGELRQEASASTALLEHLVAKDPVRRDWALEAAQRSLSLRESLWDGMLHAMDTAHEHYSESDRRLA